jgi:hypothetical protein
MSFSQVFDRNHIVFYYTKHNRIIIIIKIGLILKTR